MTNRQPTLVATDGELDALLDRMRDAPRLALDTEAASFHRYVDRVYLIQISSAEETAIVDPLTIGNLDGIGRLLADPDMEVIFHDADYDLRMLDRDYGFRARRIWDTRVAAQLAGERAFGLGALLSQHFNVTLSKQLQRADWSQRPLTPAMISYAAADTASLPALRALLADRLKTLGRLSWAEEEFALLEGLRWEPAGDGEHPSLRLKGARSLRAVQLAVLKTVWEWREAVGAQLDRATFRVLANEAIIGVARTQPTDPDALREAGVPNAIVRRDGAGILEAVRRGLALPEADWPTRVRRPRTPRDPAVDERFGRLKALRSACAETVDLDPGLVCPNGTLLAIARAAPEATEHLETVGVLRRWQREVLGDAAILAAVRGKS